MVVPYMLEECQCEDDLVTMDEHNVVKAVGKYVLKQTLGKGSMGKVKLGVHIVTGEKAAIKIVPRATRNRKLTPKELSRELRAIREGHLMMLLNHPHIVYGRDMVAGSHYYYFLMDYVSGGQLLHYIVKRTHLSEKHSRHFCRQMVSALDYMHRNSVVHRDLKIENILVDRTGRNIKIIDFGLSNLFCPERQLTTYCGSLYFAAPELLNGRPYRGPEIDVWSLGVVLYVMVTGSVPFDDKSLPGLHEKIKRAQVAYPSHVSSQCHDLLSHILIAEPQQRITLADIIRHPWLNDGRSGQTRNYMLFRQPLTLPLDEHVLGKMTFGFNLGTVDEIRMKMEVILQSSVYRVSATHVSEIQSLTLTNQQGGSGSGTNTTSSVSIVSNSQHHASSTHPNTGALKSINRAANHLIWGTYNDPQTVPAAYHPLLSIYYLTMERMKRFGIFESTKLTVVSSTTSKNNSTQNASLHQKHDTKAAMPDTEKNSILIQQNHMAPAQQSNQHQRQSRSEQKPTTMEDEENGFGHSRHSIDSAHHQAQVLAGYRHLHHPSVQSSDMLSSTLPLDKSIKPKKRTSQDNGTLSTHSTSTSPVLSTTQSTSHHSLSFSSLVLHPPISALASSPQPPQTKQPIHDISRIHLPLQNTMPSPEATSSKRNTQLLIKLRAFFRRRKNRYQHDPYDNQQQHERHSQASLPSPKLSSSDSHTIFTETSDRTTELPPIPSPTLHFLHEGNDLYHQQQSPSPNIRPPEHDDISIFHDDDDDFEKLPETFGHERSPSWLTRRLSAWMDRALILNRSTSGLQESSQAQPF